MPNSLCYQFNTGELEIKKQTTFRRHFGITESKLKLLMARRPEGDFELDGKIVTFKKVRPDGTVNRNIRTKRNICETQPTLKFKLYKDYLVLQHHKKGILYKTYGKDRFQELMNALFIFVLPKKEIPL